MMHGQHVTEPARASTRNRLIATGAGVLAGTGAFAAVSPTDANAAELNWGVVSQCESSGNWSINTGNGFFGGLQFTQSTWDGFGGRQYAPRADLATQAQQIAVAEKVLAGQGPGAWPVCSRKPGALSGSGHGPAPAPTPVVLAPAPARHAQPDPAPVGAPAPAGATGNAVVAQARTHLGVPYVWGGDSNVRGFDCSGLVLRTFADLGVALPHSAAQIGNMGAPVLGGVANAQPGDVLYWSSPEPHVAIYIGGGQLIAATTFGQNSSVGSVYGAPSVRRFLTSAANPVVAAPAAAPVAAPAPAGLITVQVGDTLSGLARAHGVTTVALYNANRGQIGDPNLIFPGQQFTLPGSAVVPTAVDGPAPTPAPAAPRGAAHAAALEVPLHGYTITQGFKGAVHQGIDMAAPLGTPEYAAAAGTVAFAGSASGFGDWIVVSSVVDGETVDFVYGHEYPSGLLVHPGETVNAGEQVGNVGANGNATGPHVHFEVWVGGRAAGHAVDPIGWMTSHGLSL